MLGLTLVLAFLALLILLPLTTSARVLRVSRELDEMRERIARLEALSSGATLAPPPPPPPPRASDADVSAPGAVPAAPEQQLSLPADADASFPPSLAGNSGASFPPPLAVNSDASFGEAGAAPEAAEHLDLEGRIGGRWLLYTGVLVLLIGVSFFLKYAFDNAWINETGRVASGGLAGLALIAGGWRLARRDLAAFGQALIGTGLAVLYLSIYAANNFYELIDRLPAFALMAAVTIAAAVIADRQRSQALAFIAVGGGFLTPFLVSGAEDVQLTLFTYDALLIAGTLVLARRHDWVALNALSYVLTSLTVLVWAFEHYRDAMWLRTLLFLTLFCVMFIQIVFAIHGGPRRLSPGSSWRSSPRRPSSITSPPS